jgi:hypothetical protein
MTGLINPFPCTNFPISSLQARMTCKQVSAHAVWKGVDWEHQSTSVLTHTVLLGVAVNELTTHVGLECTFLRFLRSTLDWKSFLTANPPRSSNATTPQTRLIRMYSGRLALHVPKWLTPRYFHIQPGGRWSAAVASSNTHLQRDGDCMAAKVIDVPLRTCSRWCARRSRFP